MHMQRDTGHAAVDLAGLDGAIAAREVVAAVTLAIDDAPISLDAPVLPRRVVEEVLLPVR